MSAHVHRAWESIAPATVGVTTTTAAVGELKDCTACLYRDQKIATLRAERDLLEQERDMALLEVDRLRASHELHHDRGPR